MKTIKSVIRMKTVLNGKKQASVSKTSPTWIRTVTFLARKAVRMHQRDVVSGRVSGNAKKIRLSCKNIAPVLVDIVIRASIKK